jgi:toxin YoeB
VKKSAPTSREIPRDAVFQPEFKDNLRHWGETDRKAALRAFTLIEAILRDPCHGIGKPEPLKYLVPGTWSRRLTQEHRSVYLVTEDRIDYIQLPLLNRCKQITWPYYCWKRHKEP